MSNDYVFEGVITFGTGQLKDLYDFPRENHYIYPQSDYFLPILHIDIVNLGLNGSFEVRIKSVSSLVEAIRHLQFALMMNKIDMFASRRYTCLGGENRKPSVRMVKDFGKYSILRRFENETHS